MSWTLVNTSRKGWVDALRALAILLVIYGHCAQDYLKFFVFTSPVKMPLFFAITGYLFGVKDWRTFVSQLMKKVVIPWLILGLLPSLFMIPFKGFVNVIDTFLGLLSGRELWFFPCFIIGQVLFYLICRCCRKPLWIAIASFACFVLGIVLCRRDILNYAMFNRGLTVLPFFFVGYLFRRYERQFVRISWIYVGSAFVLYLGLCWLSMVLFQGKVIDVHLGIYYNFPYCLFLIYLGCFILFTAGAKSCFFFKPLSFIGQNTLVLYIWHGIAVTILVKGFLFFGIAIPSNWWTALIKVIWACALCGVCAVLLNRYLPIVVGKKSVDNVFK